MKNNKTLEALLEVLEKGSEIIKEHEEKKVLKSFDVKPEWKKKFDILDEYVKEVKEYAEKAEEKMNSLRRIAWAKVEEDTQEYGQMRYNREDNTIDVLREDEE